MTTFLPTIIFQVHSLNILRSLYKDTRLGEDVVPYIADGLKAAVLGFKSEEWAVSSTGIRLFTGKFLELLSGNSSVISLKINASLLIKINLINEINKLSLGICRQTYNTIQNRH